MNEAEIKVKRTQSVLLELIPEALTQLNDNRLHDLEIVEVKCSRGRSDAKVYINPNKYSESERNTYLRQLRKATPIIQNFCLKEQGWYKCPALTFEFDTLYEQSKNIEELFKQISKKDEK